MRAPSSPGFRPRNWRLADRERGTLDAVLGLRIRLAQGALQRHFTENFAHLGLTQKQVSVLWLVDERPGMAQTDLAQTLQMDRATTMAIVHGLEKRGLLSRQRAAGDGRRIALSLTSPGTEILADARAAIETHETWLKGRFTQRELATLSNLLQRIYD